MGDLPPKRRKKAPLSAPDMTSPAADSEATLPPLDPQPPLEMSPDPLPEYIPSPTSVRGFIPDENGSQAYS